MLEPQYLIVIDLHFCSFTLDMQILGKTAFQSWQISEVKPLLMTIPNQLYKADPHECLMSLENKENNTVAEN